MKPLICITSVAVPLLRENIDTDIIIPSREMRTVSKTGFSDGLFAGWRYLEGRTPNPDFVLNQSRFRNAEILIGGSNFGCGSSREHAVWALAEYGFRVIVAPSFSPIFHANCTRNGIAPVILPESAVKALAAHAEAGEATRVSLDDMTVSAAGKSWPFLLDGESRMMLMEGLDAIELTLKHQGDIAAFQRSDRILRPWVYLSAQPVKA